MHATLPQRIVLHVHCVNTIAWAVRSDAPIQLRSKLEGLPWRWIPYVASGLPLAREVENALLLCPEASIFVLGNHGLVLGGEDAASVENLLAEVTRRLDICPRNARPADYETLFDICWESSWELPEDVVVHGLGTDLISQEILAGGLLYPCQAIFSDSNIPDLFCPVPAADAHRRYVDRPFLLVWRGGLLSADRWLRRSLQCCRVWRLWSNG